jgi:N-ethylmaleimide reductase
VNDYRKAALNAKEAGFSGVEVHGANGYLVNQFLDSKTNQRNDQYGGRVENRFRFLKEVLEAVLKIWAPEQVGVRLSPNGIVHDMGAPDFRKTFLYAAKEIDKLKLGYLHIMDGLAFGFHEKGECHEKNNPQHIVDGIHHHPRSRHRWRCNRPKRL